MEVWQGGQAAAAAAAAGAAGGGLGQETVIAAVSGMQLAESCFNNCERVLQLLPASVWTRRSKVGRQVSPLVK
jgi:hypothetical protein